jgi:hypothetical protein
MSPADSGAPLLYRFVLQYGSFSRFFSLATFLTGTVLQSQRQKHTRRILSKNFGVLWLHNAAKRDLQLWRSGEPQTLFINTSSFCYFHIRITVTGLFVIDTKNKYCTIIQYYYSYTLPYLNSSYTLLLIPQICSD